MARGRMINKKICNSRVVNELPESAQLLYTWLISHLDCNGCFYGSPQMVKSLVFPRKNYSKTKVENWLKLMEKSHGTENSPLIIRYFVGEEQYLFMPGFKGEQIGLRYDKEKPEFPTFDGKETEQTHTEVEVEQEVEEEVKEERLSSPEIETVLETFRKLVLGDDQATIPEYLENDIKLAASQFSVVWVSDAIKLAASRGKMEWSYMAGILKNWRRWGRVENKRRTQGQDPDKFIKGKHGHLVRR